MKKKINTYSIYNVETEKTLEIQSTSMIGALKRAVARLHNPLALSCLTKKGKTRLAADYKWFQ